MKLHTLILLGLMAAATLAGCKEESAHADPQVEALREVRTLAVARETERDTVIQTGEIVPRREIAVSFKLGGRVTVRHVDIGERVAAGDLLAEIDPRDIDNEVLVAAAEVEAAEAALTAARSHVDRQHKLFARGVVAKAAVEAAEADLQAALSRVDAGKAQLAALQDKRSYTEVRATEGGIITEVGVEPGEVVDVGQPVLHIAAENEREAAFNISERIVAGAVPGMRVEVALLSDPGVVTPGVLREVSPIADSVTRTYRVLVSLPEAPPELTLGATVEGRVSLGLPGVIAVPAGALTSMDGAPSVYVVDPGTHTLLRKAVTVTRYEEDRVLVSAGLTAGDLVVTAGVSKLRPDQKVALAEEDAK
jgi:RND family efflux transporter MFP subunit